MSKRRGSNSYYFFYVRVDDIFEVSSSIKNKLKTHVDDQVRKSREYSLLNVLLQTIYKIKKL